MFIGSFMRRVFGVYGRSILAFSLKDEGDGTGPHIYETLFPGYIVCHVLYVRDPRDVLSWLPFWKSDGPCCLDAAEN